MSASKCSANECEKAYHAKGWCLVHYMRMKRRGSLEQTRKYIRDPDERLKTYVKRDESTGCLEWTGTRLSNGYGYMSKALSGTYAPHRHAWVMANGQIPRGAWVDHICHNRACVEPTHLRLANAIQNGTNRAGPNANSTTGVRGVHRHKGKFRVRMSHKGRYYHGGLFETLDEAERAATHMRNDLYGVYAGKG